MIDELGFGIAYVILAICMDLTIWDSMQQLNMPPVFIILWITGADFFLAILVLLCKYLRNQTAEENKKDASQEP